MTDLARGRDVNVTVPFPVDSISHSVHKTYLDSVGRPRVTIRKRMCVEKHEQDIFVRIFSRFSYNFVLMRARGVDHVYVPVLGEFPEIDHGRGGLGRVLCRVCDHETRGCADLQGCCRPVVPVE